MAKKKASNQRKNGRAAAGSATARRRGRRSPWNVVVRVAAWILLLAVSLYGLYLGGQGIQHLFFTGNPHFTLEQLDVHVTGRFTEEEIAKMLEERWGIKLGHSNLFKIDPGELRRQMLEHNSGLINDLTLRRELPDTLELCIYERQPVARLGRKSDSKLMDAEGWILPPRALRRKENRYLLDLPVITGIREREQLETFTQAEDDCLLATLRFLRLCNANAYTNWLEVRLLRLDYAADALHIYPTARGTFAKGSQIVVPIEGMASAMRRVEVIVRERTRAGQNTSYINASYKTRVPVRP